jgi:hypothetical protein
MSRELFNDSETLSHTTGFCPARLDELARWCGAPEAHLTTAQTAATHPIATSSKNRLEGQPRNATEQIE